MFTHPIDRVDGSPSPMPEVRLARTVQLGLPKLSSLGQDFRSTSRGRALWMLSRPFLSMGLYVWLANERHWILAGLAVIVVFLTTLAPLHDAMHRSLDLSPRFNSLVLTILGGLILESGHTLRATHIEHHRLYPAAVDPEAWLESSHWWRVALAGPSYRHNLACWTWRHRPNLRPLVAIEAAWSLGIIAFAVLAGWRFPVVGLYVLLSVLGSWLFPLVSVIGVHRPGESKPLRQARTVRGSVIPRLLLGQTYHLEHHLYPMVPSYRLGALASRLDRNFEAAGLTIPRVL